MSILINKWVLMRQQMVPEMIKVIFSLKNLRRAPGKAGNMASFMLNQFGTDNKMYITNTGNFSPWPGSLEVVVCVLSSSRPCPELIMSHDSMTSSGWAHVILS